MDPTTGSANTDVLLFVAELPAFGSATYDIVFDGANATEAPQVVPGAAAGIRSGALHVGFGPDGLMEQITNGSTSVRARQARQTST